MKFIILLLTLLKIASINCDLPVHCLKHDVSISITQIIGTWLFKASSLIDVSSPHDMKCGHSEPSSEATANKAESPLPLMYSTSNQAIPSQSL